MNAPVPFDVSASTRLDAQMRVVRHQRQHPLLPDPHRMTVDRVWQRIRLHLLSEPDKELCDLLTWYDSLRLRMPSAEVWRTACGTRLVTDGWAAPVTVCQSTSSPDRTTTRTCSPCQSNRIVERPMDEAHADGLTGAVDYLRIQLAHVPVGQRPARRCSPVRVAAPCTPAPNTRRGDAR